MTDVILYGPSGERLAPSSASRNGRTVAVRGSVGNSFHDVNSWFGSLANIGLPPLVRARDPFGNHPWVFAAAMTIAQVASQAPYQILSETAGFLSGRELFARSRGQAWEGPRHGRRRQALQRHLQRSVVQRLMSKALEPDLNHPLNDVFLHPNPFQTGSQMWTLSHLWMAVRGELLWVLEMEDGSSVPAGGIPERIWPLSPDLFEPVYEYGSFGEQIGWYFCPPRYMAKRSEGYRITLPLTDVVQFKNPNPTDPVRGLSRIGAVALSVATDMLAKEYNRSVLEHGGDPGGVITYDSTLTPDEEKEYLKKFSQKHEGTSNARRTALMQGGFAYTPIALTPKDMEFLKAMSWSREEILAVMGVPASVLGVKDIANYATALAQDATFWEKTVIPQLKGMEGTLDGTLFFNQPDTVMGGFDLSAVDALRAGLTDKLNTAKGFCGTELHMDPKTAYEVVGIETPSYTGDDVAFVPALSTPVKDILAPPLLPAPIPGAGGPSDVGGSPSFLNPSAPSPSTGPSAPESAPPGSALFNSLARARINRAKAQRSKDFIVVQGKVEKGMAKGYLKWIRADRKATLAAFDAATQGKSILVAIQKATGAEILSKLPSIKGSKDALKAQIRPIYTSALDITFNFTLTDLGGLPTFAIDEPSILAFFNKRERAFVDATPETVRKNLNATLAEGIATGETVQQLRVRVAQVYDVAESSSKTLSVARTESGSFMNGVRDVMFEEQGFTTEEWSTAGDEVVRDSHVVFGAEGPVASDFNYLDLVGEYGGRLTYPGDVQCSLPWEIINCRCLKVPVK